MLSPVFFSAALKQPSFSPTLPVFGGVGRSALLLPRHPALRLDCPIPIISPPRTSALATARRLRFLSSSAPVPKAAHKAALVKQDGGRPAMVGPFTPPPTDLNVSVPPDPAEIVALPAAGLQAVEVHSHLTPYDAMTHTASYAAYRTDRPASVIFLSGVMAGSFLGFAGMLMILVGGGSPALAAANPGLWALSYGLVFPIGLAMIIFTGADLFTGNTMLSALVFLSHPLRGFRRNIQEMGRLWGLSFSGNLVGSLILAGAAMTTIVATGPYAAFIAGLAVKKCSLSLGAALTKSIMANWLVNVAIFMAASSRSTSGKILACWGPITLFVACGMEHSIANMFLVPFGMLCGADVTVMQFLTQNLIPVAIGNAIGGFLCMGAWQWWMTLGQQSHKKH